MNTITEKYIEQNNYYSNQFKPRHVLEIIETVKMFPNLSRTELAKTISENLKFKDAKGDIKYLSCLNFLAKLEEDGLIKLPKVRHKEKRCREQQNIGITDEIKQEDPIICSIKELGEIQLIHVKNKDNNWDLWKEYIHRYHYLGYKHPFGSCIRYMVVSKQLNRNLGCLLFTGSASLALENRDKWIGWTSKQKNKNLNKIINNSRFLIFPWINVKYLASKILSISEKQIKFDWKNNFGIEPVLIETFVDTTKFTGTCYKAANWIYLGESKGRGRYDRVSDEKLSIKHIFVKPLTKSWCEILCNKKKPSIKEDQKRYIETDDLDSFERLWARVINIVNQVSSHYNEKWQIRRRVIDTSLLVFLIFRLVFSKSNHNYDTIINDYWENARRLKIPLPQRKPISKSSLSEARNKLDGTIFKEINKKIIEEYETQSSLADTFLWMGHRLFAVDGSKINLPRELIENGYASETTGAHYPIGLLSCLYQLSSTIPYDFELIKEIDERQCARNHLKQLQANDVVVYDRGYYSYEMLHDHTILGIHAIFRLPLHDKMTDIVDFYKDPNQDDKIIEIKLSDTNRTRLEKLRSDLQSRSFQLRLLKYQINEAVYILGTTILDPKYKISDFKDVYHARWGIEELYKISKNTFKIEEFHTRTEQGVKQEIYAHFALITIQRIFSNHLEDKKNDTSEGLKYKINFRTCTNIITNNLETLFLSHRKLIQDGITKVLSTLSKFFQKIRPNRSYARISKKPFPKFHPRPSSKLAPVY